MDSVNSICTFAKTSCYAKNLYEKNVLEFCNLNAARSNHNVNCAYLLLSRFSQMLQTVNSVAVLDTFNSTAKTIEYRYSADFDAVKWRVEKNRTVIQQQEH